MVNKVKCTCGHSWDKSDSSKKDAYVCHICGKDTRSDVPKAQVGKKFGKTEEEVRAAILKKAEEVFKSGKKPYKVPDEISQGSYLTGRKVCIQGVCGIISDAGFIPEDYYTNTKFAEKANELGFGNPLTDISRLKPGDVFQHFTEKNEQGNYYPTHGEIFKGWNDEGKAEFYDYYDYYNYPLGMSEGIRSYSKDELVERLKRRENKDVSGKQAQFFSIAGNFPTKKSFPYNLPENELQQYFDKTHASDVVYSAPQSNIPDTSPLHYLSGEDVRQDTKNTLVNSFNDKQLDSQLKKNLKITDQDLQKIKPLIYGIVGQETQFNNPRSLLGNLKYSIENLIQPEGTSLGPGQIKLNSISKETRKKFNINKNKDLLDPKNTYVALVDILSKAANVTDKNVTPETHPELVDKDRFERALYFVNSPGKIRKTDKQLSEQVMENAPWWSNFSERKMESNIRKSKNAPLRMDATSYPGKVVSKADTLEKNINFEDVGVLPEIMVTAPKKKRNGGWLDKYEKAENGIEGTMGGLTDEGFNYNGAWGGPSMAMGGSLPGAVGFTYARTQGAAPSNGPYAKKTKASAQNGASIPVIEDMGDFKDGVWVPDLKAMAKEAKRLGVKKIKTKSGSILYFNDKWEAVSADDAPSAQNGQEMKFYQEGLDWKPRNISRDGSEIPQAQYGLTFQDLVNATKTKAVGESTKPAVAKKDLRTKKEAEREAEKKELDRLAKKAIANQPVIQTPKGRQLSEEEIKRRNKEYAQERGLKFDSETGRVESFLSPSAAKAFDRANESVLNAANYALSAPAKLVQSAYKKGYTLEDAIIGKPSGSSIAEDLVSDPTNWASLGLKGLVKGALTKGAASKGLLSSALLPFYKSIEKDPAAMSAFTSKLNEVKDLLTSKEAKSAFKNVGDVITRRPDIAALDENYTNAIVNANLPINAIDRYAKSLISIDPAENALSAEQIKYLNSINSLATDYSRIDKYSVPQKDRLQFVIDNSKNISPRDILPYFYDYESSRLADTDRTEFLKKLYDAYGGQNTANPLAEYTAATDLLSLADTYGNRYSKLSDNIKSGIRDLTKLGDEARPKVVIDDPYFDDKWENYRSNEAIHLLTRSPYQSVPTTEERVRNMRTAGKKVIETVNEIFQNPANKGKFYTGSHSLSTDSYPLTLGLFARNKDLLDFVPVHEGNPFSIATQANPMGGLSEFNSSRRKYLNELKPRFDKRLGNIDTFGEPTAGTKQLQAQMVESGLLNYHINEFNKKVGTNMPSAYYSGFYNELQRPNVGVVIKRQGGAVKDNMGYWNPDNWGKTVQIDSNDITMKGVQQPLIGVSDKGDVQYMEPGKDYKFKGKKVTEYPVKKWLDKYK